MTATRAFGIVCMSTLHRAFSPLEGLLNGGADPLHQRGLSQRLEWVYFYAMPRRPRSASVSASGGQCAKRWTSFGRGRLAERGDHIGEGTVAQAAEPRDDRGSEPRRAPAGGYDKDARKIAPEVASKSTRAAPTRCASSRPGCGVEGGSAIEPAGPAVRSAPAPIKYSSMLRFWHG